MLIYLLLFLFIHIYIYISLSLYFIICHGLLRPTRLIWRAADRLRTPLTHQVTTLD